MNLLQYKSDEMVSSTELIRKSKNIFNKLQKKEIEKAVILRDGKPQFMLLDFDTYEELMGEYLNLKKNFDKGEVKNKKIKESIVVEKSYDDEIKKDDLEEALAQIEKLGFDEKQDDVTKEEDYLDIKIDNEETSREKQALKDFWEES